MFPLKNSARKELSKWLKLVRTKPQPMMTFTQWLCLTHAVYIVMMTSQLITIYIIGPNKC